MEKRSHQLIRVVGLALPFAIAHALTVRFYGVDIPIYDQWSFVRVLTAWHSGDIQRLLSALLAQYNEYYPIVPRVVSLPLALLTRWDTRAEMWASWLIAIGVFGLQLAIAKRTVGLSPSVVVLAAALCFSLGQVDNMLWGWQIAIYLQVLFSLAALVTLSSERTKTTLLACLFGMLATFSFQGGFAVWLSGLVYLALRRLGFLHVGFWAASAAISLLAYFWAYNPTSANSLLSLLSTQPLTTPLLFFLAIVGAPLGVFDPTVSVAAGTLVLLILVLCTVLVFCQAPTNRRRALPISLPLALIASLLAWFLVTSALLTLGRGGLGLLSATVSRYVTLTSLGVFCMFLLVRYTAARLSASRRALLLTGTAVVLIPGLIYSNVRGFVRAEEFYQRRTYQRFAAQMKDFAVRFDDLTPNLEGFPKQLAFLERNRLNVFREPLSLYYPRHSSPTSELVLHHRDHVSYTFKCPVPTLYDFGLTILSATHIQPGDLLEASLSADNGEVFSGKVHINGVAHNDKVVFTLSSPLENCLGRVITVKVNAQLSSESGAIHLGSLPEYPVVALHTDSAGETRYALALSLNHAHYRIARNKELYVHPR